MRAYVCAKRDGKSFTKIGKTAAKPEAANGIRKKERSFYGQEELLRFPLYEKHTVPQRKTYGSHGGNIRFAKGKHKNNGNITRFSTRGFLKKPDSGKKDSPSRKGIKKGVPLNSNLC